MSIFTPGTGTPSTFLFFCSAVRPSSTPPATPIAPVTAGIATCVIVSRTELLSLLPPLLDAACVAFAAWSCAAFAFPRAPLLRLEAERLDPLPDRLDPPLDRLEPPPDRLELPLDRLDPLLARADLLARVDPLLDSLDPFEDERPRDEARLEDPRELVAAISPHLRYSEHLACGSGSLAFTSRRWPSATRR